MKEGELHRYLAPPHREVNVTCNELIIYLNVKKVCLNSINITI